MKKNLLIKLFSIFIMIVSFATVGLCQPKYSAQTNLGPHWGSNNIKLKLAAGSDVEYSQMSALYDAFNTWEDYSSGRLTFNLVQKGDADIEIFVIDDPAESLIDYELKYEGGLIKSAEITYNISNVYNTSSAIYRNTLLHSVGQILGLRESSRKPTSIMNVPITADQKILKIDVKDLYYLYGLDYKTRNME